MKASVNDGMILLDTVPTFLLGFYYETKERKPVHVAEGLEKMGKAGFNLVTSNMRLGDDEFRTVLDLARKHRLYVIGEDKQFVAQTAKFSPHEALLGWIISDDAGDHDTSEEIRRYHQEFKAKFPQLLSYLSVSSWSKKARENAACADLIGGQCYPIDYPFANAPLGLPNRLYEAYHVFAEGTREAFWHGKPAIANVQAFDWGTDRSVAGKMGPAPIEVRNMAWQAIVAGQKGILFYSYDVGKTGVRHDAGLWQACAGFSQDLTNCGLRDTLARYRPNVLTTKDPDVIATIWEPPKTRPVIVVNTSKWESRKVVLKLPYGTLPKLQVRLGKASIVDAEIVVELPPAEVAVFTLPENINENQR
jgi:hypothetical protein